MQTMVAKRKNQRGMATVETIPLLIIFIMLVGYSMGMFGSIHTAILNSIAARAYAFSTFRNRTDLTYFRDQLASTGTAYSYAKTQMRFHAIVSENTPPNAQGFFATARNISEGYAGPTNKGTSNDHNTRIFDLQARNTDVGVAPIWVMVGYGICLNASCGDN